MNRKILFLSGLLFSIFANVFASTPAERYVIAEEKKYVKYCKKENKKGKDNMKSINGNNAFESVMLFECFKKEADYLKVSKPRGMEVQVNNLLDAKISFYNENINQINDRFDLNLRNVGNSVEEIIIEKHIYIKKEDDEKITQEIVVEQKITSLEEAIRACKNRGFRLQSSDPLESYLFDQCIKEFGFTPQSKTYSPATNLKIEKTKKAEVKKQQNAKIAPTKIVKSEQVTTLPIFEEEVAKPPVKTAKEEPLQAKPYTSSFSVTQESVNKNISSAEGKLICKVDAYGTRICRYEPKIKKNEGSFVNNLYLE